MMVISSDDYPRSMRDEGVRRRRRAMLHQPHIVTLTEYAAKLRGRDNTMEVPDFDPFDGGVDARALFLFEKPGPKTSEAFGGSGFISRNNDDPTAEATFRFMQQAALPRKATASWNVIPWWNLTREITRSELASGAACVGELVGLFPDLRVIVLVGEKAATAAKPYLDAMRLKVLTSDHPSPLVRAKFRERWNAIPCRWAEVRQFI
jgi:hypothetical protein